MAVSEADVTDAVAVDCVDWLTDERVGVAEAKAD